MNLRRTLPKEIDHAIGVLSDTLDYAEGMAAQHRVERHVRWSVWADRFAAAIVFIGFFAGAFGPENWRPTWLMIMGAGVVLSLMRHVLAFHLQVDRAEAALNRWRQVAGTLAVQGPSP